MPQAPRAPPGLTATFSPTHDGWIAPDPAEGVTLLYDEAQRGWFPIWDEALIQQQQAAYGTTKPDRSPPPPRRIDDEDKKRPIPREAEVKPPSSIYVANLPDDTTIEEVEAFFSKCGIIMEDLTLGGPKIRLYTRADGTLKGDALITFFKPASVDLAITLMDDSHFRPGDDKLIRVQKASFDKTKASTDEAPQPKRAKTSQYVEAQVLKKRRAALQKKLEWDAEEEGGEEASKREQRYAKIVVLKHMFTIQELDEDPGLLFDLKEDILSEGSKLGEVLAVTVYDHMADGICSVKFKEAEAAKKCIQLMNGRYFGGREIEAMIYDGKLMLHKASKEDDLEDEEKRIERFSQWLEEDRDDE